MDQSSFYNSGNRPSTSLISPQVNQTQQQPNSVNLAAYLNGPSSRSSSVNTEEWYEESIKRATSAPPVMHDQQTLWLPRGTSHLYGVDLRVDPEYEQFYYNTKDSKLPPPLETGYGIPWNEQFSLNDGSLPSSARSQGGFVQQGMSPMNGYSQGNIVNPAPSRPVNPQYAYQNQMQQQQKQFLNLPSNGMYRSMSNDHLVDHFNNLSVEDGMYRRASPQPVQNPYSIIDQLEQNAANLMNNMDHTPNWNQNYGQPHHPMVMKPTAQYIEQIQQMQQLQQQQALLKSQLQQTMQQMSGNNTTSTGPTAPLSYSSVAANAATNTTTTQAPAIVTPSTKAEDDKNVNKKSPSPSSVDPDDDDDHSVYRKGNVKYTTVAEVKGKIYSLAKDQYGCRFLQKKLEEADQKDADDIFSEVYDHIVELMTDPFGNYLCQKLLEHCTDKQKTSIITAVASSLVKISMNMHGTRAVQKLVECLKTPQQVNQIIDSLQNHVVPLIKDLNGNHVIQRCLQKLSYPDKQFIYNAVAGRCVEVATHKHGCCVLQRCIDYANYDQKMLLVKEVTANALVLVQNAFGNYVVQYVLDLGDDDINTGVISKFVGSLKILSLNKFSSNVVEKCLRICNVKLRTTLIAELMQEDVIAGVLPDSYGNYVIQTALTVCDSKQFAIFSETIKPSLNLIRNTPFGKKIESKLAKRQASQAPAKTNGSSSKKGKP